MGIYSNEEQSVKFAGKIPTSTSPVTIKYQDLTKLSTHFVPNKVSFHKTGYIGVTDKNGKRLEDGNVNLPFAKIDTFTRLAIIGLRDPSTFPEATQHEIDNSWSAVINMDDLPRKPYSLHLFLTKKGFDPNLIQKEEGYLCYLFTEGIGIDYDIVWFFSAPKYTKDWSQYTLLFTFNRSRNTA
ncbi:hypothetical protein KBC70_01535 [Candidatus Woesebacteria bacterium]|nr:hypothetical protein [Candidatus Woesebacteria bacterium]